MSFTEGTLHAFLECVADDQPTRSPAGVLPISMDMDLRQVQDMVSTPGQGFQGTDGVLRWVMNHDRNFKELGLGFVVLSSYGPGYTTVFNNARTRLFILLYNDASAHWKLAYFVSNRHPTTLYSTIDLGLLCLIKPLL